MAPAKRSLRDKAEIVSFCLGFLLILLGFVFFLTSLVIIATKAITGTESDLPSYMVNENGNYMHTPGNAKMQRKERRLLAAKEALSKSTPPTEQVQEAGLLNSFGFIPKDPEPGTPADGKECKLCESDDNQNECTQAFKIGVVVLATLALLSICYLFVLAKYLHQCKTTCDFLERQVLLRRQVAQNGTVTFRVIAPNRSRGGKSMKTATVTPSEIEGKNSSSNTV